MATKFSPATRKRIKLRLAIDGAAGSGKTYTALRLAHCLGSKVFVVDTQYGSAALYAGEQEDGNRWEFQHAVLGQYTVEWYEDAIHAAERAGADVIVIDSLSSAWDDAGGILDQVDREANKTNADGRARGTFSAWSKGGQLYKQLVKAILSSPCHIIATLRTKTEYSMEKDATGKTVVKKIGMKPIQREGIDYEFDLGFSMNGEHVATVTKTHSKLFPAGMEIREPGRETANRILEWLESPAPAMETAEAPEPTPETAPVAEAEPTQEPEPTPEPVAETKQTPEDSIPKENLEAAEITAKRAAIQHALRTGEITREEFSDWRKVHRVEGQRSLTDYEIVLLFSDLETKQKTGEWNPIPF